ILGQGTKTDRSREQLGVSDAGVIFFRRKLLEQAAIVAAGGEPKGVIRDPEKNNRIVLPGGGTLYGRHAEGLPALRQLTMSFSPLQNVFFPHQVPEEMIAEMVRVLEKSVRRNSLK